MKGRRIPDGKWEADDLDAQVPGDYGLSADGRYLWLVLPVSSLHRMIRIGTQTAEREPRWTVTEEPDGSLTVHPSINAHPVNSPNPEYSFEGWHGWLRAGEWSEA